MTARILGFALIASLAALLVCLPSTDAKGVKPAEEKFSLGVEIVDAKDFDQIVGYVLSTPRRKVRIALANVLPYSKWPAELTEGEKKIKEEGLQALTSLKKSTDRKTFYFHGHDKGDVLYGDLEAEISGWPDWNPHHPSGKVGWGMTHLNAMFVDNGFTVSAESPKALEFDSLPRWPKQNRRKLFIDAEDYAIKNQQRLWRDGPKSDLARRLKQLAIAKD